MNSEELKQKRENLGITQAQLAEILGVKENTVYRWESNRLPISQAVNLVVETISQLKISNDDLVGNDSVSARVFGSEPHNRIIFNLRISDNTKLIEKIGFFRFDGGFYKVVSSEQIGSEPFLQLVTTRWR